MNPHLMEIITGITGEESSHKRKEPDANTEVSPPAKKNTNEQHKPSFSVSPDPVGSSGKGNETTHQTRVLDASKLSPVQKIVQVDVWSDDREQVIQALNSLSLLCKSDLANCKEASNNGFGLVFVILMRKWSKEEPVVLPACTALGNVAGRSVVAHADTQGVLDILAWALASFPKAVILKRSVLLALGNLCHHTSKYKRYIVTDLQLLPVVVQTFKNHCEFGDVVDSVCFLLNRLATDKELGKRMIESGSLEILAKTAQLYVHATPTGKLYYGKSCATGALKMLCQSL